jgi:hypothetical protein
VVSGQRPDSNLAGLSTPALPVIGKGLQSFEEIAPNATRVEASVRQAHRSVRIGGRNANDTGNSPPGTSCAAPAAISCRSSRDCRAEFATAILAPFVGDKNRQQIRSGPRAFHTRFWPLRSIFCETMSTDAARRAAAEFGPDVVSAPRDGSRELGQTKFQRGKASRQLRGGAPSWWRVDCITYRSAAP